MQATHRGCGGSMKAGILFFLGLVASGYVMGALGVPDPGIMVFLGLLMVWFFMRKSNA
jgi:hypothetical protein